jgi:hypothetical protein
MTTRERKSSGPSGLAEVRIMTKSVRVEIQGGETYDIPLEGIEKGRKSGRYLVNISQNKDKVFLHPVPGQYVFSFKQFGNRQNEVPTNKIQRGGPRQRKDGKGTWYADDELVYTAVFQVDDDDLYGGLTTATNLPYIFAKLPGSADLCDFDGKTYQLKRNEKFFWVVGKINIAMDVPFDYSDDPAVMLTTVEKLLQGRAIKFLGTLNKDGFIDLDSISAIPEALLAKAPAKKATKKPASKK